MAQATTIKGGKVAVLLGDDGSPVTYAAPCGFTQRSVAINKGTEDVQIPDCDNPDDVDWLGSDAISLAMTVEGETVLAEESVETWLDAVENTESLPAKVIWTFPAKIITWTGRMQVSDFSVTAANGRRVTGTVSMRSDGKMTRVVS